LRRQLEAPSDCCVAVMVDLEHVLHVLGAVLVRMAAMMNWRASHVLPELS